MSATRTSTTDFGEDKQLAIIGIGEVPQGRLEEHDTGSLQASLVNSALNDCGLDYGDIDALVTVSPRAETFLVHAASLAERFRIRPEFAVTIEAGGVAPVMMLDIARGLIREGRVRTVLLVAADMPLTRIGRHDYRNSLSSSGPINSEYEAPYGVTVPSLFALIATAYMHEFSANAEHLEAVALQDREMAGRHQNAHFRDPMSSEQYRESAWIAEPLRLFDCAPVSDGGAALVVTSVSHARELSRPVVRLASAGFSTNHMHLSTASSLSSFSAGEALDRALGGTGIDRTDIDVAFVYDCYSIAMLMNLEDLGFVAKGEAGHTFLDGAFALDGGLPVNPHGGLLSHGHTARAGGIGHVVEAVTQLRGEAGERQVNNATLAMVHGMGGIFATHGVALLERTG